MAIDNGLRMSTTRIVLLTILTSGIYFFYWLYVTWKQLQNQTKDIHFPIWHALSMLVPIYGLFRFHRHVAVIRTLAVNSNVATSLSPTQIVTLFVLNLLIAIGSTGVQDTMALVALNIIRFTLVITSMVWSQATLNDYWQKVRGEALQDMPLGTTEKVLMVIGAVIWVNLLLSGL